MERKKILASIAFLSVLLISLFLPLPMPEQYSDNGVIRIQEGLIRTKMFIAEIPVPVKAFVEVETAEGKKILLDPFVTTTDPRAFLFFTFLFKAIPHLSIL